MDLPIAEGMKTEWAELQTRRHFLGRAGKVLGWAALASLGGDRMFTGDARAADSLLPVAAEPQAAPLRSQGQASDLPVHVRRPTADGPARLQTEPGPALRQRHSRLGPRGAAAHRHDRRPGALSDCAFALGIQAVRQVRHLGERSAALHGAHGRRPHHHQVDQHRRHQSRAGHHAAEYRQHECRQTVPRSLAFLRAGQHERQPAHLHGAAEQVESEGKQSAGILAACGAAAFFPRNMRESGCVPRAIRFFT